MLMDQQNGGPVVAVQVDNETSDWKYLLALKQLAEQVNSTLVPLTNTWQLGMLPAYYAKTGWPGPGPGTTCLSR